MLNPTNMQSSATISSVPADGLAPSGDRPSAGTVMTKSGYVTWNGNMPITLVNY